MAERDKRSSAKRFADALLGMCTVSPVSNVVGVTRRAGIVRVRFMDGSECDFTEPRAVNHLGEPE